MQRENQQFGNDLYEHMASMAPSVAPSVASSVADMGKAVTDQAHKTKHLEALIKTYTKPTAASEYADLAPVLFTLNAQRAKLDLAFKDWQTKAETIRTEVSGLDAKVIEYKGLQTKTLKTVEKYLALKTSTNDKKLMASAKKVHDRKGNLEGQRHELDSSLREILAGHEMALLKPFSNIMHAYYDSLVEGAKIIAPLKDKLDKLSQYVEIQQAGEQATKDQLNKQRNEFNFNRAHEQNRRMSTFLTDVRSAESRGIRDLDAQNVVSSKDLSKATEHAGQLYFPSPSFAPVWVVLKGGVISYEKRGQADTKLPVMLCTV